MVTDLLIATLTLTTPPTAAHKWHGYPIPYFETAYVLSHLNDLARQFVPRHMGQDNVGIVSHPAMPVAEAEAGGFDSDDDTVGIGYGIGDLLEGNGTLEPGVEKGLHRKTRS
jgi:hypothetical protein